MRREEKQELLSHTLLDFKVPLLSHYESFGMCFSRSCPTLPRVGGALQSPLILPHFGQQDDTR